MDDAAVDADAASRHRGRGDRQSLLPGERDDAVGRRADVPRPDPLHAHGDARHSGTAIRCAAAASGCQERAAPSQAPATLRAQRPFPAVDDAARTRGSAFPRSEEALHALQRQQPARPGDAREVRAGDRDHAGVAATRSAFVAVVVEYPLDQGLSGVPVGSLQEAQNRSDRVTPAGGSSRCGGRVERLPVPRHRPLRPRALSAVVLPALASTDASSVRGGHSRGAAG